MQPSEITQLLDAHRNGDEGAFDRLLPLVYDDLKKVALGQLSRRPRPGLLSPTTVVHEAYLRLSRREAAWNDREHFYAVAARAMRHVVVDFARRRKAEKRGGGAIRVDLDETEIAVETEAETVLAIDAALRQMGDVNPRLCRVFECRYFGGLSQEETCAALGLTERTAQRDWAKARAFLRMALGKSS